MRNLVLRDSYFEFSESYDFDESTVFDVFDNADRNQSLDAGISLHLKRYSDRKNDFFLLGVQIVEAEQIFAFGFWVPVDLVSGDPDLLDLLEAFSRRFGLMVEVSRMESRFFRHVRAVAKGDLRTPYQVVKVLGSPSVPYKMFLHYQAEFQGEETVVDCFCVFAINENLYFSWLRNVKNSYLMVESEWLGYLNEIKGVLSPIGGTKLKIRSSKVGDVGVLQQEGAIGVQHERVRFEFPEVYQKPFVRIVDLLHAIGPDEKVMVVPDVDQPCCLFCEDKNLSREHIIPQWMKKFFPEKMVEQRRMFSEADESFLVSYKSAIQEGKVSTYGVISSEVCVSCNNGWLAKLEEEAKRILTVDGERIAGSFHELNLSGGDELTLARWVAIKSFLLARKAGCFPDFSEDDYNKIREGKLPESLLVEMVSVSCEDVAYMVSAGFKSIHSHLRLVTMDGDRAVRLADKFVLVSLQIGKLIFRISVFDDCSGLRRESSIVETKVLFPLRYELPFFRTGQEHEFWEGLEDICKLWMFHLSLSLADS